MRLITRQTKANTATAAWREQYPKEYWGNTEKGLIYRRLVALGENPSPDMIDRTVGNESWTATRCHECEANNVDVVELGEVPDYESATAHICKDCLLKALALLS